MSRNSLFSRLVNKVLKCVCMDGTLQHLEYKRPCYSIYVSDHGKFRGFVCRKLGFSYRNETRFTVVSESGLATKFSIPADAAQFADEIRAQMHPFVPIIWDLNANKEVGPDPSRGG